MNKDDITPMKRYRTILDEFRSYIKYDFEEITLNKSSPKFDFVRGESYEKKGVKNDFILIFKSPFKHVSFALSFQYIELPKEQQKVQASIKRGKDNETIEFSIPMSLNEFKDKLLDFNIWALNESSNSKSKKLSSNEIIDNFSLLFLSKKLDLQKELKQKEADLIAFSNEKSKELNLSAIEKEYHASKKSLDDAYNTIKSNLELSSEFKELTLIEKRVELLKKTLNAKEKQLHKNLNINMLTQQYDDIKEKREFIELTLKQAVEKEEEKMQVNTSETKIRRKLK